MNVHNPFLHGDLVEKVYIRLPPGFSIGMSGMVCRLRKSMYGLCRAPHCWYAKLAAALRAYGFFGWMILLLLLIMVMPLQSLRLILVIVSI